MTNNSTTQKTGFISPFVRILREAFSSFNLPSAKAHSIENAMSVFKGSLQEGHSHLTKIEEYIYLVEELNDKDYSSLLKVLGELCNRYEEENEKLYKETYHQYEEKAEDATMFLLGKLSNRNKESFPIKWSLLDYDNKPREIEFEACKIDSETWEILKLYAEDSKGNLEGYTFKFTLEPNIQETHIPCCYCEYVSSTDTIRGNRLDSNCDTWGTSHNVKAKSLYAFYIEDLDKFAIVNVSYYVF